MSESNYKTTVLSFMILLAIVIALSVISNRIWGAKAEKLQIPDTLIIESEMTIKQFGETNGLPDNALKIIFELKSKSDLEQKLSLFGTTETITSNVKINMALISEESSKNWQKIAVKFILWFIFLISVFFFFRNRKVTPPLRNSFLFISLMVFGVILGSDPGPMGTVKDAVYLFATAHAFFPPRMIALTVFLLMVFLANKFICAWGCQAGTLQDLIFRFNRSDNHKPVIWKQFKLPFVFTNSFRILLFFVFTFIAVLWEFDIIEQIDIFKIYKPEHLGIIGVISAGILLFTSLFIYRPWCHLFCPFGLAGWFVEKLSYIRITVNYKTCIACKKCADTCPSTVMSAILLKDKKTIPDCFSCYTCRDVCPTGSIKFDRSRRTSPPEKFFKKKV